jgi:TRAP-type C4-dicarboxylate transport system permease small subunit
LSAENPGPGPIERVCEIACGLCLVSTIGLVAAEAVCRNLLGFSLQVSDELGGYLLVAVGFLSLPFAQVSGAFHHVALIQGRMTRRGRLALQLVFDASVCAASAVLAWQLIRLEIGTWRSEDVAPTLLATPLWIPRLAMPVGMSLLCVSILRTAAWRLRRMRDPT